MDYFRLIPTSLAYLAESMLALTFAVYLIQLRNKSRNGWLVTFLAIVFILDFVGGFWSHSLKSAPWHGTVRLVHLSLLGIQIVYGAWFAYNYRFQPQFYREARIALVATTLIVPLGILAFATHGLPLWLLTNFLVYLWNSTVYFRRAHFARSQLAIHHDRQADRDYQALKAFARLSVTPVFMYLMLIVSAITSWSVNLPLHVLILVFFTWLFVNFINYSSEPTSFLVKIVGLFQCLMMLLLGTPALAYPYPPGEVALL